MSRLTKEIWDTAIRLNELGIMDMKIMEELRILYEKDVQDEESLVIEEEIFQTI